MGFRVASNSYGSLWDKTPETQIWATAYGPGVISLNDPSSRILQERDEIGDALRGQTRPRWILRTRVDKQSDWLAFQI